MQTNPKHRSWLMAALVVGLAAVAGAAQAHGILPPEALAALSMAPFCVGEISMAQVKELLDKQGEAFAQFKSANDERLKAIETKGYAPSDLVGKVDTINADLTKLGKELRAAHAEMEEAMKKAARPPAAGGDKGPTPEQLEHKAAFSGYLRKGTVGDLAALERKAMTAQSDPDGGFLVGAEMDTEIDRIAAAEVSMRRLANVRVIGKASYKKLVKTRGVAGRWEGESEEGGESTANQYSEIEIFAVRGQAEPWVPNDLLDDADYDLEADLAQEAGTTFAELEGTAFINGTGVKQPRGFLSYTAIANASYAWGKIGYIATGVSADFAASNKADKIIDLQHSLKQRYRPGAVFLTSDATLAIMRQFKDSSGNYYLWNPDPSQGVSGTFLGSPVEIDDYMPVIAANSYSVAFGNFKKGYTIVDRRGIALIRDNVTKKGTTKFNFTKRVGGGVTNFEAIKLLKFGTS